MLSSGSRGRATNSVISSGGANFFSVSRGDVVYSNRPPSIRSARLSMSVLTGPSSLSPDQTVRAGRARDLEAHHVELLAEAVQPRWPGVAGVALQVVLTGERRNRLYGLHLQVAERHRANRDDDESASEHEPSPSRATSASSSSEIGD